MTPPAGARHFTISSTAGKHGDIWSWTLPDGSIAYRMSMSLRGWITEDDELMTLGADGRPTSIAIRGFTDQGDATEDFNVDEQRRRPLEDGSRFRLGALRREALQHLRRALARRREGRRGAGRGRRQGHRPSAQRPCQHQHRRERCRSTVRRARRRSSSPSSKASASRPSPVWLDSDNHFFGNAGIISLLPEGYEKAGPEAEGHSGRGDRGDGPRRRAPVPQPRQPHADPGRPCADVRFGRRAISARSRGADRRRQGRRGRRRRLDQGAGRRHRDRRPRQDVAPGPVGFAPACRRRRLEPAAERRDRNDQLPQPRHDDR